MFVLSFLNFLTLLVKYVFLQLFDLKVTYIGYFRYHNMNKILLFQNLIIKYFLSPLDKY